MLKQSLRYFPVSHPAHISFLVMSFSVISMWLLSNFFILLHSSAKQTLGHQEATTDSILSINELLQPLQKVLGQFLGIVGMALAEYDLPTKPTNIGRFYLGFLGICRQKVISAKDCWQYWWTLAFKKWQTLQST